MSIKRDGGSFSVLERSKSREYFEKFGRSDFVLYVRTETTNAMGRQAGYTEATTTGILGDLQFDVKLMKEYVNLGIAQTGDGIFYTVYGTSISANDEISEGTSNTRYKLVSQVEGETTNGNLIYQGWIARRIDVS